MKSNIAVVVLLVLLHSFSFAQQTVRTAKPAYTFTVKPKVTAISHATVSLTPRPTYIASLSGLTLAEEDNLFDNQDDPAYAKYKEGYNLILQEQWSDAREKFSKVISSYPKSEYRDDAEYWSAYALKHIDKKKAIDAYTKFIKENPKSSYYDDAVADVDQLRADVIWVNPKNAGEAVILGSDGYAYTFTDDSSEAVTVTAPRATARDLRVLKGKLGRLAVTMPKIPNIPFAPMPSAVAGSLLFDEEVDPETRLKLDALYAIGDAKQDEKSFLALKEVALDTRQKERLRYAALDIVSGYKKYDVMSIYTEIAKKDTSQNMQSYAIDYISYNSKDKNKSVAVLIDLFNATPKSRPEQKRRIFYAIAEVGNDNAVDFLSTVARNNDDYELRREAIFYLGTIGGEKSRTALYEILMGKSK